MTRELEDHAARVARLQPIVDTLYAEGWSGAQVRLLCQTLLAECIFDAQVSDGAGVQQHLWTGLVALGAVPRGAPERRPDGRR